MPYHVLILDDDADFNSLLADIFEQADYKVTPMLDPIEAVDVFRDTDFDLVVTDHKMPGMTGAEYMKVIKELKPEIPVIMVSGYLENDIIRELISDGVGGVFLKPLNIFSLLERTSELIEEAQATGRSASAESAGIEDFSNALGFTFRSFQCKGAAAIRFAERLYSLRNFKSTLSLVGEPGAHYRSISEDIQGFYGSEKEHFLYFPPAAFDQQQVIASIVNAKSAGAERVTCVLLEIETMSDSQKQVAVDLAKGIGLFADADLMDARVVFCISGDLDTRFDEGVIDESLYILMGTAEVGVPSLADCQYDVPSIAQSLFAECAIEVGRKDVPRLDASAISFLEAHPLVGGYSQLREVVRSALGNNPKDVVDAALLQRALESPERDNLPSQVITHLIDQRAEIAHAASILYNGDRDKVARFFASDNARIEDV